MLPFASVGGNQDTSILFWFAETTIPVGELPGASTFIDTVELDAPCEFTAWHVS